MHWSQSCGSSASAFWRDKVMIPYFPTCRIMLAKLTSKNQLTLPKAITQAIGPSEYFDVQVRDGQIILTPVRIQRSDAVRAKLAELALTEADIEAAVAWVRSQSAAARHVAAPAAAASRVPAAKKSAEVAGRVAARHDAAATAPRGQPAAGRARYQRRRVGARLWRRDCAVAPCLAKRRDRCPGQRDDGAGAGSRAGLSEVQARPGKPAGTRPTTCRSRRQFRCPIRHPQCRAAATRTTCRCCTWPLPARPTFS